MLAGNTRSQPRILVLIRGEFGSMPTAWGLKINLPPPSGSGVGSGQFGTPWECMHWVNSRMALRIACSWAWVAPLLLLGSRCWQSFSAAWYWELLTPSCCALGNFALGCGSGKFGTPCERTQREKARSWEVADPPGFDEPLEPADDGLLLHAAASRARTAVAMMAVAARAMGGRARRVPARGICCMPAVVRAGG